MAQDRKLSDEEVQALLDGATAQSGLNERAQIEHTGPVKEFVFGQDDLTLLGDYYALRVINERFSRLARVIFQPMLHLQPRITSLEPTVQTYAEYCETIGRFMSLSTSRVEELRGSIMIVMPPSLISIATDAYYGGAIRQLNQVRGEFTGTEQRILEIITEDIKDKLCEAWRDLMEITLSDTSFEENAQFASFVDAKETIITCTFQVQLPDVEPLNLDMLYPIQTLKPIASQLRSRVQTDVASDDLSWKERLESAVMRVPLNLTAVIAEPTITMSTVYSLLGGETLPVSFSQSLDVRLDQNPFFTAEIGEVNGTRALSLKNPAMDQS